VRLVFSWLHILEEFVNRLHVGKQDTFAADSLQPQNPVSLNHRDIVLHHLAPLLPLVSYHLPTREATNRDDHLRVALRYSSSSGDSLFLLGVSPDALASLRGGCGVTSTFGAEGVSRSSSELVVITGRSGRSRLRRLAIL